MNRKEGLGDTFKVEDSGFSKSQYWQCGGLFVSSLHHLISGQAYWRVCGQIEIDISLISAVFLVEGPSSV